MNNENYTSIYYKADSHNTRVMSRNIILDEVNSPDIVFETLHPNDMENNYIWSFIGSSTFFSASYSSDDDNNPKNYHQLHYHEFFELIYVISGTMYQQIESERHLYTAGSLCLLNCFICHQEEYSTDFRALFLRLPISLMKNLLDDMNSFFFEIERSYKHQLLDQFFSNNLDFPEAAYVLRKEYIDFIPLGDNQKIKDSMYSLFDNLTRQLSSPTIGSTYLIKGLLVQILCELSNPSHYQMIPLNIGTDSEVLLFNAIRNQIQNSHGHISRAELESNLSYSGSYLNRIVKKYSGYSLKQFALSISLKEAADLLQNSDMAVNEICEYLQFSNQTYFYSSFQKKYGLTPKKYRENYLNSLGKI